MPKQKISLRKNLESLRYRPTKSTAYTLDWLAHISRRREASAHIKDFHCQVIGLFVELQVLS
jgi:hypothetical protein